MSMLDWAKKEIELACKKERFGDADEKLFNYGVGCYESALKAFESLCNDGHSGTSIQFTKAIFDALIDGRPLTSIEDTEDVWNEISYGDGEKKEYQCLRMSSLFKNVGPDGTVTFNDVDRVVGYDMERDYTCPNGLLSNIVNILYPITMPYHPPVTPFKVYFKTFLVDKDKGDYDTMFVSHIITPNGERVAIDKCYKEEDNKFVEIGAREYYERKEARVDA